MMFLKLWITVICILVSTISVIAAEQPQQSQLNPAKSEAARQYPRIVLFSVSWCPHCKVTKEYFTKNNIPFINRDVEIDEKAMQELTGKYNSTGVPVVVIGAGSNEVVMKGFTPELFQESLKKARTK